MSTAAGRFFGLTRYSLKRVACVLLLSLFSVTAAASACCDSQAITSPGHTDHLSLAAGDGIDGHHCGAPDFCQEVLEADTAETGMAALTPSAQSSSPPDVAAAPQYLHAIRSPHSRLLVTAVLIPRSLPLYLQTSRLLI